MKTCWISKQSGSILSISTTSQSDAKALSHLTFPTDNARALSVEQAGPLGLRQPPESLHPVAPPSWVLTHLGKELAEVE